jgi:hypothetical protein
VAVMGTRTTLTLRTCAVWCALVSDIMWEIYVCSEIKHERKDIQMLSQRLAESQWQGAVYCQGVSHEDQGLHGSWSLFWQCSCSYVCGFQKTNLTMWILNHPSIRSNCPVTGIKKQK